MYAQLNWVIFGIDNGLLAVRRQAIIQTSDDFLSITSQGTDFNKKNDQA